MRPSKTLFILLFALFPALLQAQTLNDFGSWTSAQVIKSLNRNYLMARAEHRSFSSMSATECWFLMAGGGRTFNKYLKADLSYEFWKIPSAGDIINHKVVLCGTGTLKRQELSISLREKYEFAVNPANGAVSHTLRSRIRAQYTSDSCIFVPYFMYELFNGFGGKGWIRSLHYIGAEIKAGKHNGFDLFYMYHNYNQNGTIGSIHLIGIGYNLYI